jgi:hypothetical protein
MTAAVIKDFSAVRPTTKSLVRACAAYGIAAFDRTPPAKIVNREWSHDGTAEWLVRAATVPADTSNTPAIVRTVIPEFISTLAAQSVAARLFKEGLQLSFDGAGNIAVPTLLGDSTYASFVKEGDPIPVAQGKTEPLVTLTPRKLAVIVVMTVEMIRSSNIETLMLDALTRSVALALDTALFDANPDNGARPAGIRYGVTALTASSAPDPIAALMSDIETLHTATEAVTATHPVIVMSPTRALMANLRSTIGLSPLIVLGSGGLLNSKIMIAVTANNIASALEGVPDIATTVHAAVQMTTTPGPGATEAVRSMWQTDCVAILLRLPVTWAVRSATGISWLTAINW